MLRVHTTSAGLDPSRLEPGADLVLRLDPVHGTGVAQGVYAFDHLAPGERRAADLALQDALVEWRERAGEALTAAGICWPLVWHAALYERLGGPVTRAIALRAAASALGAERLAVADDDPETLAIAHAVGAALGLEVELVAGAGAAGVAAIAPPPVPNRVRRALLRSLTRFGAPTTLRRGSVLVRSYWPLMPLVDGLLGAPDTFRTAIFFSKRPEGMARSLRAARGGGWVGVAGPLDRRRARAAAARIVAAAESETRFAVGDLELGPVVHDRIARLARERALDDLAEAALLRRAYRRSPPAWVVVPFDVPPEARLRVLLAREAGVRTLGVMHGTFILPEPFADLELCDEVALWSRELAPSMTDWDRPIHLVGYPLPHGEPPPTRPAPDRPPRIAVLGQLPVWSSCTLDDRITMRTYETALGAIARRFPGATVVLRPHVVEDRGAVPEVVRRFPELDVELLAGGDILAFQRGVDLCIGGASSATLQAALAGTPAIVLNLSGWEWRAPLGGETAVPVAATPDDLDAILASWRPGALLPGRGELLAALGVDGGDATSRLMRVLGGVPAPEPVESPLP